MVSVFLFYTSCFVLLLGLISLLIFSIIYIIERRYENPFFTDIFFKKCWKSGYWSSLILFTKSHPKWLVFPLLINIVIMSCDVLSSDYYSQIITVYGDRGCLNYSKRIVLFPKTISEDFVVNPFDADRIIVNESNVRLLLRKNTYSKSYSKTDYYSNVLIVRPDTIFYCNRNFPEYILEEAPSTLQIRRGDPTIKWSLEVDKYNQPNY